MGTYNPKLPTKHTGTDKYITFFVSRNREPTLADYRQPETGTLYSIGTVWQVAKTPTTGFEGEMWILTKIISNQGYWVRISSGTPSAGPILTLSDTAGTLVYPTAAGNVQLQGTSGISIVSDPGNNKIVFSLSGGGTAIDSIAMQTGTSPVVPDVNGLVTFNGAVVAAGTNPVRTDGTGANTMALEVQISQALAAADATKIGLSNFDSSSFAVSATGFVTLVNQPANAITQVITQIFTVSGTYTPTAGMRYCIIELVGGGGGGGGTTSTSGTQVSAGGGGGGAGYSRGVFSAATIGASKAVTIGAAGTAGVAGGADGGTGGTTSVGATLLQATGGGGGQTSGAGTAIASLAGAGGVGSLGNLNIAGGAGHNGTGVYTTAGYGLGGHGGDSALGGGQSALGVQAGSPSQPGQAANVYGGGGSGASCAQSNTQQNGGLGGPGVVFITEFLSV